MKFLALFLATIAAARAMSIFGDGIIVPPGYSLRESMLITASGVLILDGPGTYTATNWSVSGEVRLATPGNYIIVASSGSIAFNRGSMIRGPLSGNGTAKVTFVHAGDFLAAGSVDSSISVSQGLPPPVEPPPLVNISTRTTLASGQTLSSGFVIGGRSPRRVLLRAIGPTLADFRVANPLTTPTLVIMRGETPLAANAGWGGDASLAAVFSSVGAFALPPSSRDAALVMTLNPGSYTVQIGGGVGEVLAEIYLVD